MAEGGADIFDRVRVPPELDAFLRETNPWWSGEPQRPYPRYRRWAFEPVLRGLVRGMTPGTVIRGPRQVGKSTLQAQVIDALIKEHNVAPSRVLRVQFDDIPSLRGLSEPVLEIGRWFQNRVLGRTFNAAAHAREPAFLILDEVQNLRDWAPQIKSLIDHHGVRVLITGSSALRIQAGGDSIAGRVTTIELGPLLLREIAGLRLERDLPAFLKPNGLEPLLSREFWGGLQSHGVKHADVRDAAFDHFERLGGYPRAHERDDVTWAEVAEHLNETVVKRVIQHDLRVGERGRKRDQRLLEEVFRLACRYAGQCPSGPTLIEDVRHSLHANIGFQRVAAYFKFLDLSLLIRLVEPHELRLKRKRGPAKVCLCDHALRAAWMQEVVPLSAEGLTAAPHLSDMAGRMAESVVGYFLSGLPHLGISHFPPRGAEPEVDYVLTIGDRRIPVEVKYQQRIDPSRDTRGLRAFIEKTAYNADFGVLVTLHDNVRIDDPRIVPVSMSSLLLMR